MPSDFTLARESLVSPMDYPVGITEFEDGSEQRRLLRSGVVGGFKITSPKLTKAAYDLYLAHFNSCKGSLYTFGFTSPNDGVRYTVRYVKGGFSTRFEAGVRVAEIEFVVVNS